MFVRCRLQEFFGREISKTCDGDESVARGCALQCAMLSPAFRVKEFEVHDLSPYPIDFAWGAAPAKTPESLEKFTDPMVCAVSICVFCAVLRRPLMHGPFDLCI
jgi:molecular chaperone DnaK (HSP70)